VSEQKGAPFIDYSKCSTEQWVQWRPSIEQHLAILGRISEFAFLQKTDVAIGIQRLWYPPEVCKECGETNDFVMDLSCDCWVPVEEYLEGEK
jgi:hypothetical protein